MFKLIKKISINPIPSSSSQTLEDVLPESFKSKDIPSYLRNLRKVSKPTDISDYQLIKILGVGSYGTVWLSKSKINQQVYALKVCFSFFFFFFYSFTSRPPMIGSQFVYSRTSSIFYLVDWLLIGG